MLVDFRTGTFATGFCLCLFRKEIPVTAVATAPIDPIPTRIQYRLKGDDGGGGTGVGEGGKGCDGREYFAMTIEFGEPLNLVSVCIGN